MNKYKTILDHFEITVKKYPNKLAFEDPLNVLTYSELLERSKRIASCLADNIQIGKPVAIIMDKSVHAVCILLAVVYAGGAYSFIDSRQPENRINNIIDVLHPDIIIFDDNNAELVNKINGAKRKISVSEVLDKINQIEIKEDVLATRRNLMLDTQPLYINFTSGSTGVPKGVVISHRSVMDFIINFVDVIGIRESDIIGNQAPFDFDVSVKDIFGCIFTGAKCVLIPRNYFTQPLVLMDYLCDRNITVLIWAVSALCFITIMKGLEYRCPSDIRIIGFSGECMPIKHFNKLKQYLSDTVFVNLYGPTEITCNCTYYVIPEDKEYSLTDSIPIGIPFDNENVFLLNDSGNLIAEKYVIGEICVSGTCLALGYYGNAEKTNEVFVQNPINSNYRELIYRTGDMAQYDNDGNLVYISRKDFQIKHMGHRIELGEIESVATSIKHIERAVCIYLKEKSKIILFYSGDCKKEFVEKYFKDNLPCYMIPNKIHQIKEMPMNKNGKIDREKLRELV